MLKVAEVNLFSAEKGLKVLRQEGAGCSCRRREANLSGTRRQKDCWALAGKVPAGWYQQFRFTRGLWEVSDRNQVGGGPDLIVFLWRMCYRSLSPSRATRLGDG